MSSYSGSFKQSLAMPQQQYRQEGARPPVNQKHMKGHGELLLPDQHLTQLQLCFQNLWAYLTMQGQRPNNSTSASLSKLAVLTMKQMAELTTDVCDEIARRIPETRGAPPNEPLQPRPEYIESRNESRRKLADLKAVWLSGLICDIWTELRRRHPEFRKFEVMQEPEDAMSEDEDEQAEEVEISDVGLSRDPSRQETRHMEEDDFDDSRTDEEAVDVTEDKASWLADAEDRVRRHLGEGRCSHDYLHADRLRRQAVALAMSLQRKGRKIDVRVVEVSALFTSAVNDPKYPIKDPKDFVQPYTKAHANQFDSRQAEIITRIASTVGLKRDERRRKEGRQTDFHKTCLELHCVQDADKLEMIGLFGILRVAATFGTTHKPLCEFGPSHRSDEAVQGTAMHHVMDKARVLPLMITAEGKAAAIRRIEKMRQFQTDLAAEYDCVGL